MTDIDLEKYYLDETYDLEKGVKTVSCRPKLDEDEIRKRKATIQEELFNILHKYKFGE